MTRVSRRDKANAIRALSMDAVERAASGHPGAPMGMADIAEVLWSDFLKFNPQNPDWCDRDRFVLSNGHASMLLYSLLHLSGYDLALSELKAFRQLHSKTPGHPEFGDTPGVECTTGPLGQGLGNAVGMALAEKTLAAQFNRDSHVIVDHYTYVFAGDGCLMEGVSHEVCSLASTLGLGKLIVFYDDNGISIDGEVADWFCDDTPARFAAYGWRVLRDVDGHDAEAVAAAIRQAQQPHDKPTLICCKTTIGFGAPTKAGSASTHGAPLGADEIARTRENLNWRHAAFEIPEAIYRAWDMRESGARREAEWLKKWRAYERAHPQLAAEFTRRQQRELPSDWNQIAADIIAQVDAAKHAVASRKASQIALESFAAHLPELLGGSADLTGSNLTTWSGSRALHADPAGNYIYYGVREFGMCAVMNGLALHRGFKPYGGTFLMFAEYARNAVRMAALMRQPSIFVFTHDSIGLGEDGPTHQPVEQLAGLRVTPNLSVWRPCDAVESAVAWQLACESTETPFALVFSRQTLPHQARAAEQIAGIARGAYVLHDCENARAVIIATGAEVALAMHAARALPACKLRVVSMPSCDFFDAQSDAYRESVLPKKLARRISIEAGVTDAWRKYIGVHGLAIGVDDFGVSAPAADAFAHFGLTDDAVTERVRQYLDAARDDG